MRKMRKWKKIYNWTKLDGKISKTKDAIPKRDASLTAI